MSSPGPSESNEMTSVIWHIHNIRIGLDIHCGSLGLVNDRELPGRRRMPA